METIELTPGTAGAIEHAHNGKIRLVSRRGRNYSVVLTLSALCILTLMAFMRMDFGAVDLGRAAAQTWSDFCAMMFQPSLDPPLGAAHFSWAKVAESTLVTVAVTVLCTIISAVISFFSGAGGIRESFEPACLEYGQGICCHHSGDSNDPVGVGLYGGHWPWIRGGSAGNLLPLHCLPYQELLGIN